MNPDDAIPKPTEDLIANVQNNPVNYTDPSGFYSYQVRACSTIPNVGEYCAIVNVEVPDGPDPAYIARLSEEASQKAQAQAVAAMQSSMGTQASGAAAEQAQEEYERMQG